VDQDSDQTNETRDTLVKIVGAPESCLIEGPLDPCVIVIIGACGDLTRRKIIRALFRLFRNGVLPTPPIFAYPTLSEIHKKSAGKYYAQKIFSPEVRSILKFLFGFQG